MFGSLIVGIFVARYLGPEQFGLMNYVVSYVSLFQVFALFGMDSIEVREEARAENERDTIIGTAFAIKCVSALATMLVVIGTAIAFEADSFTMWMIILYSASIMLSTGSVVRNYFTSIVWNEYIVKTEITRTLIGLGIKVILLLLHAPLIWFIFALLFDAVLLFSGYMISYSTKIDSIRLWKFDKQWAKYLVKQSFPLLLTGTAVIIYQQIDQVMIGNMIDKTSVGYFSVASRFVELLMFVPAILAQTISPILVRIREQSQEQYGQKAQIFMNVSLWTCILMSVCVSLLSYWLIWLTYGREYLAAVPVLQILSFKAASVALSSTAGQMIVIEKLQKYAIFRDIFGCIVCVGLNYILLPRYGVTAAAIVAILSNIAAGYIADIFIPPYHHLFRRQTKALLFGWKDMINIRLLLTNG